MWIVMSVMSSDWLARETRIIPAGFFSRKLSVRAFKEGHTRDTRGRHEAHERFSRRLHGANTWFPRGDEACKNNVRIVHYSLAASCLFLTLFS